MANNDLPAHTQLEIMTQYGESAMFKQFFSDWRDVDETDGLGEEYVYGLGKGVIVFAPLKINESYEKTKIYRNPEKSSKISVKNI
jgi:hypothetical protein